jgi:5S rRNA maturation endonuclease (ribonuclease M5)
MALNPEEVELRAVCPFCDSVTLSGRVDPKFYYNPTTGLYFCFHCQEKGKTLDNEFLEELDVIDEIHKSAFDRSALASLTDDSRELREFIKERFGARGFQGDEIFYSPEKGAIALPTFSYSGEVVGIKYRFLAAEAKPRYTSEPGSLNEGYWLRGEDDSKLLIVEGEIDALTAREAGFRGSILATQTNKIHENAVKLVKGFKNVFVLPDKDLGGEELKNSIQGSLGGFKAISEVVLPDNIKDLNEMLQRRGYEECSQFVRMETRSSVERDTRSLVESLPELHSWLSDERNTKGDPTGWKCFDALIGGGLRAGEMSVINAFAKTGKSSFINSLIHNLAKNGKKIALASFEMDPARFIYPTLLSIAYNLNIRTLNDTERRELLSVIEPEMAYLNNIVTLRRFGYTPWQDVEEWAIYMKKTHKIDYLVLDHAGFMVEKMTDAEENQTLAKNIKRLTNELGIHILVVVQAPKTKDGLSIQTSYGGLAWGMNADNFIILERSKDNDNELRVKLEAARYPGANPSSTPVLLFYQRESCALTE